MPTQSDLIALAYRVLGVGGIGEAVTGDEASLAVTMLENIEGEMSDLTFSIAAPTTAYMRPLANLLAVDLAPTFPLMPPMPRSRAVMALRAAILTDDREDARDLDDDGTVDEAEAAAGKRAAFY